MVASERDQKTPRPGRARRSTCSPRSRVPTAFPATTTSSQDPVDGSWVLNGRIDARPAPRLRAHERQHALRTRDRGGAAGAQRQRPRQRTGRHRLPLRRRGEHDAPRRARGPLDDTKLVVEARAGPACRLREQHEGRRRSSTRSATTSTPGRAPPRSARSRTRRPGIRTTARGSRPAADAAQWVGKPAGMHLLRCDPGDGLDGRRRHPALLQQAGPGALDSIFRAIALDLSGSRGQADRQHVTQPDRRRCRRD